MNRYTFGCNVQFDEEVLNTLFQACFGYKRDGTFVEVGAYDGKAWSHTYALAKLGWRGVYVEPVPALAAQCMANHADHSSITVLRCAAGAAKGTCTIHVDANCCCGSTLNPIVCKDDKPFQAQMRTLNSILAFEGIEPRFDLLSIDVEFAECEVLKGFDPRCWLPRMIIIELCETHGGQKQEWARPAREMAKEMFEPIGYTRVYGDKINTVYVKL